jgi:asparagine synthase (glutamine-hydrolysing)
MCGITGFNHEDRDLLARMNHLQRHRGPDHEGRFVNQHVSMGHRRLSIIDISEKGHQPMISEDGSLVISYNGEVYNFKELKTDFEKEGYRFRSQSDTEVVLAAYDSYGRKCLDLLNGMFAFAIYDKRRAKLLLARDRFGIKPLYYFWDGKRFAFASEIKALLEYPLKRELNIKALAQFFTFRFNYGKETLFRNIFKLPPGHFLSFDLDAACIEEIGPWWELSPSIDRGEDTASIAKEVRELLHDSVSKRLISDVPLGFFLSGGLDSTIVTGIAGRLGADLKTFSAGFETTNELSYASTASRFFGTDHQEVRIGDEALELLDDIVYHMDEPIGDAAFLATFILSREARRKVKVVLAGEGADELFAGYDRYKIALYGDMLSFFVPSFFKSYLTTVKLGSENWMRLARILSGADREARYLEVIRLFSKDEMKELAVTAQETKELSFPSCDILKAIQFFDVQTVLPNDFFMKADKMSSAWGLEERVPFLDHRVVELAFRIPSRAKLRLWDEKHVLKKAFADLVPPEILRRRKHGFNVPMDHWLKGPLYHRSKKLLEEDAHDLYSKEPVLELLENFRQVPLGSYKGSFFNAQKLWSVLTFELWFRRFFR